MFGLFVLALGASVSVALAEGVDATPTPAADLFRGVDGTEQFYLPQRFRVPGGPTHGVELGIYSLIHEGDLGTQGLENGAVLQGGFLAFLITTSPGGQRAPFKPVAIRWKAVDWSLGPTAGVVPQRGDDAFPESVVNIPLRRQDVDLLRAQGKLDSASRTFHVSTHFVVPDHERLADSRSSIAIQAHPRKVRESLREWTRNNPAMPCKVHDVTGSLAANDEIPAVLLSDSSKFVQFCVEREAVTIDPTIPKPLSPPLAAGIFAVLRNAWLEYRLGKVADQLDAVPVAIWRAGRALNEETPLEGHLAGWVEVERYARRDVSLQEAAWIERIIAVDGFQRETKQCLHFTFIGDWDETGLDRLALEAQLIDPISEYQVKKTFSIPRISPLSSMTFEMKGRYSDQLRVKWRVALGMFKNGKAISPRNADAWSESRIPNFDAFFQLSPSDVAALLSSQIDLDRKKPAGAQSNSLATEVAP